MITATLAFDGSGCLRRVRLSGHAGFALRGTDVVCAAASVLVRTFARTVEGRGDIDHHGSAPTLGEFCLELGQWNRDENAWLAGVADGLTTGLADLASESPGFMQLLIEHISEEKHGT